ncbi:PREDICTED: uncharacterized protein LOC104801302 [Tarenaya hassleriana]|uniref:uncharacterized protein LOC104801302 n=1 Tax=Tarenaya hassleriana TaxID=28532 RepID=UPI00053C11F9|nr:PREDICTED: uncharacterized protein LOC104801302 [Tarenaya hassleriana]
MGNSVGSRPSDAAGAAGKVVLSDGRVQNLEEPTTVAELMLEHPQHVVVEFDPSSISFNDRRRKNNGNVVKKKLTPLPADKTLDPGKIYLMLPSKRRGAKVSTSAAVAAAAEEMRRMLSSTTALLSYYEGILPWFARVYPAAEAAGERDVTVAAAAVGRLTEPEAEEEDERVRPGYLSRQLSGKGWKPSLDTIKEKRIKRKIHHMLSF